MYGLAFNKLHVCQHWEATEIQNRYVKLKKTLKANVNIPWSLHCLWH